MTTTLEKLREVRDAIHNKLAVARRTAHEDALKHEARINALGEAFDEAARAFGLAEREEQKAMAPR